MELPSGISKSKRRAFRVRNNREYVVMHTLSLNKKGKKRHTARGAQADRSPRMTQLDCIAEAHEAATLEPGQRLPVCLPLLILVESALLDSRIAVDR